MDYILRGGSQGMSVLHRWIIPIIILTCVLIFILPSPGHCDKWVYVGQHEYYLYYYNNTNIEIDRQSNQIKVWTKLVYTNRGREWIINDREKQGLDITDWNTVSNKLELILYDYHDMKYRILSGGNFTNSGEVLGSFNNSNNKWENIPPESIIDTFLDKILEEYNIKR